MNKGGFDPVLKKIDQITTNNNEFGEIATNHNESEPISTVVTGKSLVDLHKGLGNKDEKLVRLANFGT